MSAVAVKPKSNPLLSKVSGNFAGALHGALCAGNNNNAVYSPFSVHCALAMTLAGAANETAEEMRNVLKIGDAATYKALQKEYDAFLTAVDVIQRHAAGKVEIAIANRIYAESKTGLADAFVAITRDAFHSQTEPANFSKDHEGARGSINRFVEETTKGLIKDLISKGVLSELTRMVLVNAIYFKGQWKKKFEKPSTYDSDFYLTEGKETCKYKAMPLRGHKFHGNPQTKVGGVVFESLSMPYQGGFSMVFLLPPNSAAAMLGLEAKITELGAETFLDKALGAQNEQKYDTVVIPRCKIESTVELTPALQSLGMNLAFRDGQANFTGIQQPPQEPLCISAVIHKAYMKIDEEGTEAAAATAVVARSRSMVVAKRTEFIVNRPFLAMLIHDDSRVVLFTAKVTKPVDN